ncbi:MAG: 30S ribosomal protein S1, partial [Frankia sp.]|nr:30S ribosomal protein S1 [Frankia sp.]
MSDERSGPGGQRVRVVLERAGGIVGRPIRRGLDTADLPPQEADSLRALAAALPAPASAPPPPPPLGPAP